MIPDDYIRIIGMPAGATRVSLGRANNFADVYPSLESANAFVDVTEVPTNLPPRLGC